MIAHGEPDFRVPLRRPDTVDHPIMMLIPLAIVEMHSDISANMQNIFGLSTLSRLLSGAPTKPAFTDSHRVADLFSTAQLSVASASLDPSCGSKLGTVPFLFRSRCDL